MDSASDRMQNRVLMLRAEMAKATVDASESARKEALEYGSTQVDAMFSFKGQKADPRQKMSWPRTGVRDKDGAPVVGVPVPVNEAAYFLAGLHLIGKSIGSGNRALEIDVVAYLLLTLHGLLDDRDPMQAPHTSH